MTYVVIINSLRPTKEFKMKAIIVLTSLLALGSCSHFYKSSCCKSSCKKEESCERKSHKKCDDKKCESKEKKKKSCH